MLMTEFPHHIRACRSPTGCLVLNLEMMEGVVEHTSDLARFLVVFLRRLVLG